jgi:hypothetical protein
MRKMLSVVKTGWLVHGYEHGPLPGAIFYSIHKHSQMFLGHEGHQNDTVLMCILHQLLVTL